MSINDKPHAPVELDVSELPRQDGEGRVVRLGIKAWASTPFSDADPGTDRQEASRTYHLSWDQLLELQEEIARQ